MESAASIEVSHVSKTFGGYAALSDVSLKVPLGELVALLGPSGSGKTTLLRIIAGLETADPSSGPILFHNLDVARIGVGKRGVGFVFQHYALFRHMTVFENVAFGLRVRPRRLRPSPEEIRAKVRHLLKLVQLEQLESRYPGQLSGGQRQRVALARRWPSSPKSSCWTSRSAHSMPRSGKACGVGSANCMTRFTLPACSLPTIRKRPWKSPTGSW